MEKKRNLWVIPTDKPSRLHEYDFLSPMGLSKEPLQWRLGRNIYITSDEVIKEGDWVLDILSNKIIKSELKLEDNGRIKKIILTTYQDLIGVQAIPDEFLEWFVKNPSCEWVEVFSSKWYLAGEQKEYLKIIIPKEEPKQETLEEVAERIYPKNIVSDGYDTNFLGRVGLYLGAKWQQERICEHNYILTTEQGHRIIKCLKCNNIQPI